MLGFEDPRWNGLEAGYRTPIDLRPLLRRLESDLDPESAWHALWQELYHQGDVGEGSFAAVPHLVRIHRARGTADWNTYALAATIELARGKGGNPDVSDWMREDYQRALRELAQIGLQDLPRARDQETVRSILAVLAIMHGARTYGRVLAEFTEDEVLELEDQAFGSAQNAETPGVERQRQTRVSKVTAAALLSMLDQAAPGFRDYAASGDNVFEQDSVHGLFAAYGNFVRDRSASPAVWPAVAEILNQVVGGPDPDLDNAACTCFLENLASRDHPLGPLLRGEALASWRRWCDGG